MRGCFLQPFEIDPLRAPLRNSRIFIKLCRQILHVSGFCRRLREHPLHIHHGNVRVCVVVVRLRQRRRKRDLLPVGRERRVAIGPVQCDDLANRIVLRQFRQINILVSSERQHRIVRRCKRDALPIRRPPESVHIQARVPRDLPRLYLRPHPRSLPPVFFSSFPPSFRPPAGPLALLSRSVINANHRPSGDHSGASLDFFPRVNGKLAPAATFPSQICRTYAFSFQSVSRTRYATNLPSGEMRAPPIVFKLSDSSSDGVCFVCAWSAPPQRKPNVTTKTHPTSLFTKLLSLTSMVLPRIHAHKRQASPFPKRPIAPSPRRPPAASP